MIETVFRTDDLPVGDRADAWREKLSRIHAPVDVACRPGSDLCARQRVVRVGDATVWSAALSPQTVSRTTRLIRRSDPEVVHVALITRGTVGFRMGGTDALYGPGEFRTNDSGRPCDIVMGPRGGVVEALSVDLPRAGLPLPSDDLDRVVGQRMTAREGVGAVLSAFLVALAGASGTCGAADAPRLETVLVDLLAALFANRLDATDLLPAESRRRTQILRVQAFIRDHLHDPGLTPAAVAAAHHISTSHLHRLFQDHETTVSGWIRRQRLERARALLADPARSDLPVHLVAVRAGFEHHAVFTRAFRSAYGVSPRDYRRCALLGEPAAGPGPAGDGSSNDLRLGVNHGPLVPQTMEPAA